MALYIAAAIGSLIVFNKRKKSENVVVVPTAPPCPVAHSFKGRIVDGNFYYGETTLKLSDIRIVNIHVKTNDGQKVDGKIIISSGDKKVFSERMNNGWINAKGLLAYNSTLRIETKSKKELEYTIYYM